MSKIIPNTFQTPNAHVDQAMHYLTGDQYKVLNYAVRHVYGWHNRPERYQGRIALSVFVDGFTTEDGQRYLGVGLGRNTVIQILDLLVKFGLLAKAGEPTVDGQKWGIGTNPHWDLIIDEYKKREAPNVARVQKMNDARARKRQQANGEGVSSDDTSVVAREPEVSSHDTGEGSSDDTHIKPCSSHAESHEKETTLSAATQQSAVSSQSANQWPDGVHSPFPLEGETEIPAPAENVEMGDADATTALSPHSAPPPFPQWAVKDPSFNEFSADRSLVCLWNARASIMVCIPVGSIAETEGGSVAYVFKKTSGQDALEQTTHLFLLNAVKKWHSSILQLQNRSVALVFEILGQEEKFWSVVMGLMEGASRSANGFAFSTSLLINQRTIWAGTATIAELTTTTTPSLTLTVSYLDTWGVNTLEEISESFAQTVIGAARTTSKAGKKPSNERTPQPPVPAAEGKSKRKTPAPNRMGLILDKAWRKSVSNFLLPQLMGNASKPDRKPYNISPACSEAELWAFGNWWRSNHPAHIQVPTRANAVYDAIMGFRGEEDYESRVSDAEYDVSKMFPREGVAPVETPTAAPASPEQLAEVSANLTKLMESFRQENVS